MLLGSEFVNQLNSSFDNFRDRKSVLPTQIKLYNREKMKQEIIHTTQFIESKDRNFRVLFFSFLPVLFFIVILLAIAQPLLASPPSDSLSNRMVAARAGVQHFMMAPNDDDDTEGTKKQKTIGGAFLRSVVIPGWGQKYAGAPKAARNFFVADIALWVGVISYNIRANWLKDDYQQFSVEHAQVDLDNKDDIFFVDAGRFDNVDAFNQSRLRQRDATSLYSRETDFWQWDSESNRIDFANRRVRSDRSFSRSELLIGVVLLNHLISGIHAAWIAHKHDSASKDSAEKEKHSPEFALETTWDAVKLTTSLKF